jgi:hypothetical protein
MLDWRELPPPADDEEEPDEDELLDIAAMNLYLIKYGARVYHDESGKQMIDISGVDCERMMGRDSELAIFSAIVRGMVK